MNLVIDQGNSQCKVAVFDEQGNICLEERLNELTVSLLEEIMLSFCPDACILSSVRPEDEVVTNWLRKTLQHVVFFSAQTPLPLTVDYGTPGTLGADRLAAAVGARTLSPGRTLLVIDMGTAITYDLVSRDGVYLGGNIAPGIRLRFKSLHENTGRLPLVEPKMDFDTFGKDTQSAIQAGVMQGIVHEVRGYMDHYKQAYPDLFAFLTGGDLIYFAENLKSGIFVSKNLVLTGLNAILNDHVRS